MRAHLYRPITNAAGAIQPGTVVRVLQPGSDPSTGTTVTVPVYDTKSGSTTLSASGFTTSSGVVDLWLDSAQFVQLGLTAPGQAEVFIDNVPVISVDPPPAPAAPKVTTSDGSALVLPKTAGAAAGSVLTLPTAGGAPSWVAAAAAGGFGPQTMLVSTQTTAQWTLPSQPPGVSYVPLRVQDPYTQADSQYLRTPYGSDTPTGPDLTFEGGLSQRFQINPRGWYVVTWFWDLGVRTNQDGGYNGTTNALPSVIEMTFLNGNDTTSPSVHPGNGWTNRQERYNFQQRQASGWPARPGHTGTKVCAPVFTRGYDSVNPVWFGWSAVVDAPTSGAYSTNPTQSNSFGAPIVGAIITKVG